MLYQSKEGDFLSEYMTYEETLKDMLSRVPNDVDKRQGSIIYDALAPTAIKDVQIHQDFSIAFDNLFPDTTKDEATLIRFGAQRQTIRKSASQAIVKGVFRPSDLELEIGARFTTNDLTYALTEKISAGVYKLVCETAGTKANHNVGQLIPVDYIQNLQYGEITEVLILGEDIEDIEHFRERVLEKYYSDLASNGNVASYKEWVNSLQGVGGVKIYRAFAQGGYVGLTIQDSEYGVPTQELIDYVAQAIDPENSHGEGNGMAPFGHYVTVRGVTARTVNISAHFSFQSGYSFEELKPTIIQEINKYFLEENKNWASYQLPYSPVTENGHILLKIAKAEAAIINIQGVANVENLKYNNVASSLELDSDEIAELGEITNES